MISFPQNQKRIARPVVLFRRSKSHYRIVGEMSPVPPERVLPFFGPGGSVVVAFLTGADDEVLAGSAFVERSIEGIPFESLG